LDSLFFADLFDFPLEEIVSKVLHFVELFEILLYALEIFLAESIQAFTRGIVFEGIGSRDDGVVLHVIHVLVFELDRFFVHVDVGLGLSLLILFLRVFALR
jgi:hypothetical protein